MRAHIIPECFFRSTKEKDQGARLLSIKKGVHPKRAPKGVYDEGILCADCEKRFSLCDDYGQKVLLTEELRRTPLYDNGRKKIGYLIHGIDYSLFKLFFLSVLWRAAVSSHQFFGNINLGPHFKILDNLVRSSSPGSPDDFAVFMDEYVFPFGPSIPMSMPFSTRMQGLRCYALFMGKYAAVIKVDKQPYSAEMLRLQEKKPFGVILRNFEGSSLEPLIWNAIKNNAVRRASKGS